MPHSTEVDALFVGATDAAVSLRDSLAAVTARARGPNGDVYALERDRTGRHGSIMKYNLNAE